ncbi:MAG: choice-of-anchor Q domain-containing protein, partial [Planctomycetota bacterium]
VWNCTIDDNVEDGISNIWETAVVRNCIITNNGINGIGVTGGAVDHTYNLVWGNGWNFSGTTVHGTEVEQDPLFISAADRHLQSGSPAIDVGTDGSSVTTLDFDGQARPIAAGWDIGYDEYGSPTATPRIVRWQEVEP